MKRVLPLVWLMAISTILHLKAETSLSSNSNCMECLTAPILFCPSTYFGCPDDSLDPSLTGTPVALRGDTNCPEPIVTYQDTLVIDQPCLKKYHRIWKASYDPDSASTKLYAQCIQTLYLEDQEDPVLSACPQDIIITLDMSCDSTASWQEPVATDDCGLASLSSNFSPGDSFTSGTTLVQYIAEDICGRRDSCSFNVQLAGVCCLNLDLLCPSDTTVCVNSALDPAETGMAMVQMPDSTCIDPLISFSDSLLMPNPGCSSGSIIERTWFASDSSQSVIYASCTQVITTNDNTTPVISGIPADITVTAIGEACSAIANWTEPTVDDDCGIFAFDSNIANGSTFPEGVSTVNYVALDNCSNTATASFTVTVECELVCSTNPTIQCPPDFEGCPTDSIPGPGITGMALAAPGDSLCFEPLISYSDSIFSSGPCPGDRHIIRTWTAADPENESLTSSCEQHIIQKDKNSPTIQNIPDDITLSGMGVHCSVIASWTEPSASDDCSVVSFNSNIPSGTSLTEGVYTVVYTAIDGCGHIATKAFTITVECETPCSTPPVIYCPSDYWACPDGTIPSPNESGYATAFATDPACGNPIITFTDVVVSSGPCSTSKIVERTWKASDPEVPSLYASCIQTLSLEDFQPPQILYCPQDISVNVSGSGSYCSSQVSWDSPLATDNCGAPDLEARDSYGNLVYNGQVFDSGTTHVIYTATDDCGNTRLCQFNVTVQCINTCNTAPEIWCPPNRTVCPGSSISPQQLGYASASAGPYCPQPSVNYTDVIVSTGPCYGEKFIKRTWTASYYGHSGLSSSCVQNIQLEDTQKPHFTYCPPDVTVYDSSMPVYWNSPQATDNCGSPSIQGSHYPGSYFPQGSTTVNYTAKDDCWNTAYCSFTVTVENTYNITLNCPPDISLDCDGNGGAYAHWTPPVYSGSCGNCDQYNNNIPGFIYMGSLNGSEYYCSNSPATWPQAKQICESKGGYLASIGSQNENQYLADILTLQSAWIGLNDAQFEGQFKWHSGEILGFTNWHPGQPNNYNNNQDYVEMLNDGKWNDQYNHYALEFIMELPCTNANVIQTSGPSPGSYLSAGNYTVEYEVSDGCGGFGSCSFYITVNGNLDVTCPDDITVQLPANSPGVPVSWQEPQASTCCAQCSNNPASFIPGFVYMGSLNGHDYYCSTAEASWPAAQLNCESKGGHLAIINSEEENNFLAQILNLQSAWIGLTDSAIEGTFKWVDGQIPGYTNWYPGQPNNYNNNQDYVEMLNDGKWNDQYNHYALEYIMEIPSCINITQTGGPQNGSILPGGSVHTVSYNITDACGNSSTCSFSITVESGIPPANYCASSGTTLGSFYIDKVSFGTIDNQSGDNDGYMDYTNYCTMVDQGYSYPMHLTPGNITPGYTKYWRIWLDLNKDGDFYDQGEMIAYGSGTATVSGMVTIPHYAAYGETRMRIIVSEKQYQNDPCGIYDYGETEDYCVFIRGTKFYDLPGTAASTRSFSAAELKATNLESEKVELQVYPNPASEMTFIEINGFSAVDQLFVTDMNGKQVKNWSTGEIQGKLEFYLNGLPSGVYMIHGRSTGGIWTYSKLIIAR